MKCPSVINKWPTLSCATKPNPTRFFSSAKVIVRELQKFVFANSSFDLKFDLKNELNLMESLKKEVYHLRMSI